MANQVYRYSVEKCGDKELHIAIVGPQGINAKADQVFMALKDVERFAVAGYGALHTKIGESIVATGLTDPVVHWHVFRGDRFANVDSFPTEAELDAILAAKPAPAPVQKKPEPEAKPAQDNVNHPKHYTQAGIECIDALNAATVGKTGIEAVCVANVIKYLWRYEEKNGLEDICKAEWYLGRLKAEYIKAHSEGK